MVRYRHWSRSLSGALLGELIDACDDRTTDERVREIEDEELFGE